MKQLIYFDGSNQQKLTMDGDVINYIELDRELSNRANIYYTSGRVDNINSPYMKLIDEPMITNTSDKKFYSASELLDM